MKEDVHFYIDNAPPTEVLPVLRVLSQDVGLTPAKIGQRLQDEYGVTMQRDRTYSPRRLFDLGLARQEKQGAQTLYFLSETGARLQNLLALDAAFVADLLHFAHFSGYRGAPEDRKSLWSYRRCCERMWNEGRAVSSKDLAVWVQGAMRDEFPQIDDTAKKGGRFNSTAASCVNTWVRALEPSPLGANGKTLEPRPVERWELATLALDDLYCARGYRYGDGVVLDDALIHQLAGVFFLNRDSLRAALRLAVRLSERVEMRDTLAGPAVNLKAPFGLSDV